MIVFARVRDVATDARAASDDAAQTRRVMLDGLFRARKIFDADDARIRRHGVAGHRAQRRQCLQQQPSERDHSDRAASSN